MRFLKSHPLVSPLTIFQASSAILNIVLPTHKQWTDFGWTAITTDDHIFNVATGSEEGEPVFVAIAAQGIDEMETDGVESIVTGGSTIGDNWHRLLHCDGPKTKLPADWQLFESVDGRWRESDQRVTLDQGNGFVDSDPQMITIDGLLSWLYETRHN